MLDGLELGDPVGGSVLGGSVSGPSGTVVGDGPGSVPESFVGAIDGSSEHRIEPFEAFGALLAVEC